LLDTNLDPIFAVSCLNTGTVQEQKRRY